jgi:hypothetical protein
MDLGPPEIHDVRGRETPSYLTERSDDKVTHGRSLTLMRRNSEAHGLAVQRRCLDTDRKPDLAIGECLALVRLAGTASHHWNAIGTPRNIVHADLLFSWALARAGAASPAVNAAGLALKYFTENQSKGSEMAFAHAAMAASLHCAGDQEGHRRTTMRRNGSRASSHRAI